MASADRMNRIYTMVQTLESARMHPVDPVHPVQNAGSLFPSAAVGWAP